MYWAGTVLYRTVLYCVWQYHPEERIPIDGFLIYFKQYDAAVDKYQTDIVMDMNARSTVISNLTADTQYSFYIKCFNSHSSSPSSNIVVRQTLGSCIIPGWYADFMFLVKNTLFCYFGMTLHLFVL